MAKEKQGFLDANMKISRDSTQTSHYPKLSQYNYNRRKIRENGIVVAIMLEPHRKRL